MSTPRWQRLKRIHAAAMELAPEKREAFVRSQAAGDETVLTELLDMLAVEASRGFLEPRAPGPAPEPEVLPRRLGDFELLERIGDGGMGVVYRARQLSLEREVAVKVLAPDAYHPRHLERFLRESHAGGKLGHPGIVPVHAVGVENGEHYFAMELIVGRSLHAELQALRAEAEGTPRERPILPRHDALGYIPAVVRLFAGVAQALHHAHQHGVVHRDVKPHNILLDFEAHPYVADFGLAKVEELGSISHTGEVAGTIYYMSPEQALAKRVEIDHRTDIFSLGVVLYEALTLHRPFEGHTSHQILYEITFHEPKRLRKQDTRVPRDLEIIVDKALEKVPDQRYVSALELAQDLELLLQHQAPHAQPRTLASRVRRHTQRWKTWYLPSGVAALALVVGIPGTSSFLRQREVRAEARPILEWTADADLATQPIETLVRARDRVQSLLERGHGAPALEELLQRIHAEGERRKALGLAARERGLASPAAPLTADYHVPSDTEYFRGQRLLEEAELLLPDDRELAALTEESSGFPRVTFAGGDELAGAEVYVQSIDWLTQALDEPRLLGTLPFDEPVPVEPGFHRFTVVRAAEGAPDTCELTRMLDQRGTTVLRPYLRPTAAVTAGMVLVPAGEVGLEAAPGNAFLGRRQRALPAFWVDVREVTVAEYRRFLAETGHAPPASWRSGFHEEWNPLPVIVDFAGAQAYAEWAGKRLATHVEWDRAARGGDARPYPWGAAAGDLGRAVLGRPSAFDSAGFPLPATEPPGSALEDVSVFGLLDVLGNVSEWTESIFPIVTQDGTPRPDLGSRIAKGAYWDAPPGLAADLATVFACPVIAEERMGIRCAKGSWPAVGPDSKR